MSIRNMVVDKFYFLNSGFFPNVKKVKCLSILNQEKIKEYFGDDCGKNPYAVEVEVFNDNESYEAICLETDEYPPMVVEPYEDIKLFSNMKLLLINFKIRPWLEDNLIEYIRNSFCDWCNYIDNSFIVVTRFTPNELSRHFKDKFGSSYNLFIVEIKTKEINGLLIPQAWDWFREVKQKYSIKD